MKIQIAMLILGFSLPLRAITLPMGTKVFDEYQQPLLIDSLKEGDSITVVENGNFLDAEVENLSIVENDVVFDVLDFDENQIHVQNKAEMIAKKKSEISRSSSSKFSLRLAKSLVGLAVLANLPTVGGGPVCASLCPAICPVFLAVGCHPMVQALLVGAIGTVTGGVALVGSSAIVGIMCNPITLGEMTAACVPTCTVALAVPFIP